MIFDRKLNSFAKNVDCYSVIQCVTYNHEKYSCILNSEYVHFFPVAFYQLTTWFQQPVQIFNNWSYIQKCIIVIQRCFVPNNQFSITFQQCFSIKQTPFVFKVF